MRDDSPAERMTAQSTWATSARNALGRGLRVAFRFGPGLGWLGSMLAVTHCVVLSDHGLMRQVRGAAAHGNQLGRDADGDLFRRERADFQPYGSLHAVEEFGRKTFALKSLIDGKHFALAADHAEIAR